MSGLFFAGIRLVARIANQSSSGGYYTIYNLSKALIDHNIIRFYNNCSSFSDYPNNKFGVTSTTSIFAVDYDDTKSQRDANYALSEESAAKGYAEDGSDCGPYAGSYPYVLSGYPNRAAGKGSDGQGNIYCERQEEAYQIT